MRTIKFRGKKENTGEWVTGFFAYLHFQDINDSGQITQGYQSIPSIFNDGEGHREESYWNTVDQKTVGQFTGVFDCEGREIYEGDIVILATNDKYTPWPSKVIIVSRCKVVFYPQLSSFVMETIIEDEDPDQHGEYTHFGAIEIDSVEVIGNIHDNPELLEGGEQ